MLKPVGPITFIINPISGTEGKARIPSLVRKHHGHLQPEILYSEAQGHAAVLAAEQAAKGAAIVVAVGGDGTMNEVASALIGTNTALGLLPMGSGNGLVRHLRIPLNLERALQCLGSGKRRRIDVGYLNQHPFFCTASLGFEAQVALAFNKQKTRGLRTYLNTILSEYPKYKPDTYTVSDGKNSFTEKAILFTLANANQYGNNAFIAPTAQLDDGLLNLTLVKPVLPVFSSFIALRLLTRSILQARETVSGLYEQLEVQRETEGPVHVDGESVMMGKNLTFRIEKTGLWVCVP